MADVVPLSLTLPLAQRLIQEIAADSGRVFVRPHGKRRGRQRNISHAQIINCLLKGRITEGPYQIASGAWRCNVHRFAAGEQMTCTVEFDLPQRLIVVTVF